MLFDKIEKKITGVLLRTGQRITSKYGVVSSTGYLNTMNNLVPAEVCYVTHFIVYVCKLILCCVDFTSVRNAK